MSQLLLKEIEILFNAGSLKQCHVLPAVGFEGWELHFVNQQGKGYGLKTQRGESRQFRSADAALKLAKEIGFSVASAKLR